MFPCTQVPDDTPVHDMDELFSSAQLAALGGHDKKAKRRARGADSSEDDVTSDGDEEEQEGGEEEEQEGDEEEQESEENDADAVDPVEDGLDGEEGADAAWELKDDEEAAPAKKRSRIAKVASKDIELV